MHVHADTRYNIKVFKTSKLPKRGDNRKPYQIVANNCSRAGDSGRLQLRQLPCDEDDIREHCEKALQIVLKSEDPHDIDRIQFKAIEA